MTEGSTTPLSGSSAVFRRGLCSAAVQEAQTGVSLYSSIRTVRLEWNVRSATFTQPDWRPSGDGRAAPGDDRLSTEERKRNHFTKSATGGRALSALMLPFFTVRPPSGFGVLTTTGRRTGKTRRKCVRIIRRGNRAYVVMLGPALMGPAGTGAVSAWLWNIRANPNVRLRIRGGTFAGVARELEEGVEKGEAKEVYCEAVNAFDYVECSFHLAGRPSRDRIKALHRRWFEMGVPLVVELRQ
jgi:deazaflavin-dependent oxidoreductase (nitroreductase family)